MDYTNSELGKPHAACRQAFSLVELVVVVVILGILASIAIPRLSRGSTGARESALNADLRTLQNAIQCYAVEHKNVFPGFTSDGVNPGQTADSFINQLTMFSDIIGVVDPTGGHGCIFGPYLLGDIPPLPVGKYAGVNGVLVTNDLQPSAAPDGVNGWVYNCKSGIIIANTTSLSAQEVEQAEAEVTKT